jgi:hypothetical protein
MKTAEELNQSVANDLFHPVVSLARLMLRKYGNFGPFGFYMDEERQVRRATVEIPRLPSDPAALMRIVTEQLQHKAAHPEVTGAATAANVSLRQPSDEGYADAILVHIELRDGYSTEAELPYQMLGGQLKGLLPRRVVFGQIRVKNTPQSIFLKRVNHAN